MSVWLMRVSVKISGIYLAIAISIIIIRILSDLRMPFAIVGNSYSAW